MRYIKLETLEYPRHQGDIRLEYPEMGEQFVCPDTYAFVDLDLTPEYDPDTHTFEWQFPSNENGKWIQKAKVRLLTQDEIDNKNKFINLNQVYGTAPDVIG
jgi:hypothetical protein